MENSKFTELKNGVQEVIDLIAAKNAKEANNKLVDVSEELDELLDFLEEDADLIEISKYQVLLNQLHLKIVALNGQAQNMIVDYLTDLICPCGLNKKFQDCCELVINGVQKAITAEALMRSRYTAYVTHNVDYLIVTTHISQRKFHSKEEILNWAVSNQWQKLEITEVTEFTVKFKAYYLNELKVKCIHQELSTFVFENGNWFYVDGEYY